MSANDTPISRKIILLILHIMVVGGKWAIVLVFLWYYTGGQALLIALLAVLVLITWVAHRWEAYLRFMWGGPEARQGLELAPRDNRPLSERLRRLISALATPFVLVKVMWVHLALSVTLPLIPGWVDLLLSIDWLFRIPMLVNIITIERNLGFNITACVLAIVMIPGYAVYCLLTFDKNDWGNPLPGTRLSIKRRLELAKACLGAVGLFTLALLVIWGITLDANESSIPEHLASHLGLVWLGILPFYAFATVLPGLMRLLLLIFQGR